MDRESIPLRVGGPPRGGRVAGVAPPAAPPLPVRWVCCCGRLFASAAAHTQHRAQLFRSVSHQDWVADQLTEYVAKDEGHRLARLVV